MAKLVGSGVSSDIGSLKDRITTVRPAEAAESKRGRVVSTAGMPKNVAVFCVGSMSLFPLLPTTLVTITSYCRSFCGLVVSVTVNPSADSDAPRMRSSPMSCVGSPPGTTMR